MLVVYNTAIDNGFRTNGWVRRGFRIRPGVDRRSWETVCRTDPYPLGRTFFDHRMNGITISPDGAWLFVNSGSRTDHGEEQSAGSRFLNTREVPLTSAIFRIPSDGRNLRLPAAGDELRASGFLFADGTRNFFDLAFDADGELFATENAGDRDDPEELNHIEEGNHYGFPWRIGSCDASWALSDYDPELDVLVNSACGATFTRDLRYPDPPEGVVFTDPVRNLGPHADKYRDPISGEIVDASDSGETLSTFTGHRSPVGLVFDVTERLGGEFRGDAFVLAHRGPDDLGRGPFEGDPGSDLLHLEFDRDEDGYLVRSHRIAGSFDGLPVDSVLVGRRLFVLEHSGGGRIWELTFPEAPGFEFLRGDCNGDGVVAGSVTDAVYLLRGVFLGNVEFPCPAACDLDGDGSLTSAVTDAIYLLQHLFFGGPPPAEPYPDCGWNSRAEDVALGCSELLQNC